MSNTPASEHQHPSTIENVDGKAVRTSAATLERAGNCTAYLFDLDDTIVTYDSELLSYVKRTAFLELSPNLPEKIRSRVIGPTTVSSETKISPKEILHKYQGWTAIQQYYEKCDSLLDAHLEPDHLTFNNGALALIEDARQRSLGVGIISNNSGSHGSRVLQMLAAKIGTNLEDRAVFLAKTDTQKPNPEAFTAFCMRTALYYNPETTIYIGDRLEDVRFADNIGALGVLHGLSSAIETEEDNELLSRHIVAKDLTEFYRDLTMQID